MVIIIGFDIALLNGAVALRKLHTTYCFANLKLAQYVVVFNLSTTAPFLNCIENY